MKSAKPKIFVPGTDLIINQYHVDLLKKYNIHDALYFLKMYERYSLSPDEIEELDSFLLETLTYQWFESIQEFVAIVNNERCSPRWYKGFDYFTDTNPCKVILEFNEFMIKCIFTNHYEEFQENNPLLVGLRKFLTRQNIWMDREFLIS
jgi:hypothetical protein